VPRLFKKGSFTVWKYLPVLGRYFMVFSKRDLSIFSWSLLFMFGKALDQGHYQKWAHMSLMWALPLVTPSNSGLTLNLSS
jgi:hypothetical protein